MGNGSVYAPIDGDLLARTVGLLERRLAQRGLSIWISGIDGTGKSTLARALTGMLRAEGVDARCLHWYQWYINLVRTPPVLLHNRYRARRVLIFDRTITDNLAVLIGKRERLRWLLRPLLGAVRRFYPEPDCELYLFAGFNEIARRRPDTEERRFLAITDAYAHVLRYSNRVQLDSDPQLLGRALLLLSRLPPE